MTQASPREYVRVPSIRFEPPGPDRPKNRLELLVRGGAGSRLKPVLQPGNTVMATWRARLEEHLGYLTVEGVDLRAASFLPTAHAVFGVTHLADPIDRMLVATARQIEATLVTRDRRILDYAARTSAVRVHDAAR